MKKLSIISSALETTSPPGSLSPGTGVEKNQVRMTSGVVALQHVEEYKKQQARRLRRKSTPAEVKLWEYIRNRKVDGLKFRRQQIISGFIADFYCEEVKLVIEVDGSIHDRPEQKKKDELREKVFAARGIATMRLTNNVVLNTIEACLQKITTAANERRHSLQSPPQPRVVENPNSNGT